jgi:hypothetical protein
MQVEVYLNNGKVIYPIYDPATISRDAVREFYVARFAEGLIRAWGFMD